MARILARRGPRRRFLLEAGERKKLNLPADGLAVRVTFNWGDFTRKAGIKNGDIVVDLDGIKRDMNIHQIHAHLHLHRNYGDSISVVVLRDDKRQQLTMQLPKRRRRWSEQRSKVRRTSHASAADDNVVPTVRGS